MTDSTHAPQTQSHSELFGLKGQAETGGQTQPAGSGAGSDVLGDAGTKNSVSAAAGKMGKPETTVAGLTAGAEGTARPGAGNLKPSMGSGKVGE